MWVEVPSQRRCLRGAVPWTARAQDIFCYPVQASSFPGEGSSLLDEEFAVALPSGCFPWAWPPGAPHAGISIPTAVLGWVQAARVHAGSLVARACLQLSVINVFLMIMTMLEAFLLFWN